MTSGSRVSTCEKVNMTHKLRFTKSVLCTGYLNNTSPSKFSAVAFKGMFTSFRATFILVESLPVLICPYMIPPKNVIPERVTVPELEFHSVKKSSNTTTPWKNSHSFRYEIDFSLDWNQYRMLSSLLSQVVIAQALIKAKYVKKLVNGVIMPLNCIAPFKS